MKGHQRILELHSLLSKLLDSLCFQITVNHVDQNCFSLLEILQWKKQGQISHEECVELYRSWLESKSIFDLFTCKQTETYPKFELIANQLAQNSYMNVGQITKALEIINQIYNKLYLEKRPSNAHLIQKVQRIFSYLDSAGNIHLRSSSLFYLSAALSLADNYSIPINYEGFRVHFEDVKKDMCQIDGLVSLRSFKNYFLGQVTNKKSQVLEKILPILVEMEKKLNFTTNPGLPNILEEAFGKWRHFPRFNSHDSKKNLEIYKRVFEQNEKIFFEQGANIEHFISKYGQEFTRCFQIDNGLLRQFNIIIRQILNKYLDIFSKIQSKQKQPLYSHKKKQKSQIAHPKLTPKYSGREKTPTKSFKKNDFNKVSRTPTKKSHPNNDWNIGRRQFGSAQKSKSKSFNARQTTPTKSYRPMTSNLYQSQANTNQKSAVKNGIEKDSFYNKMFFFRNKRVESYEIVIKRLKGK